MKARPLTLPQLQAARAAFDAVKAQRELSPEEKREADRLDQRFYLRCWRA